jgi:Flp pilus assembly secretin CpaC
VKKYTMERNSLSPVEHTAKGDIRMIEVPNNKIVKASVDETRPSVLLIRSLKELGSTDIRLHLVNDTFEEIRVEVVEKTTENDIMSELQYWRDLMAVPVPKITVRGYPDKDPDRIEITGEFSEGEQEQYVRAMESACKSKNIMLINLARKQAAEMPRNIFIDVWLYLVTESDMKNFGFQYSPVGWAAEGGVSGSMTRTWGSATRGTEKIVSMPGSISGKIGGSVSHLSVLGNSKQLDHQLIAITEGQKASKQFGGTVYLENITQDTSTRTPVQYGTILNIVPTVMKQNPQFCQLDIEVESSSLGEKSRSGGEFNLVVDKTAQQVVLKFGQPFLMANTFKNMKANTTTGVVGLEKIPLLGELFKNRDFQEDKKEALLVVRAQIGQHVRETPKLPQEARDLLEGKKIDTRDLLEVKEVNP